MSEQINDRTNSDSQKFQDLANQNLQGTNQLGFLQHLSLYPPCVYCPTCARQRYSGNYSYPWFQHLPISSYVSRGPTTATFGITS